MSSSLSPSSLFLSTDSRFVPQQRCYIPTSYVNNWRFRNSRVLCLSASIVERNFEFSWLAPDENGNDAYGGWEIVEAPIETKKQHQKGLVSILYQLECLIWYQKLSCRSTTLHSLFGLLDWKLKSNKNLKSQYIFKQRLPS